jgi:Tol biopolymer transport system component
MVIYQLDVTTQESSVWLEGEGHLFRPLRSPNRTQVAYFVWHEIDEYYSLWIADADGTNARQLSETHLCADGLMAEWSFDSRYIAFRSTPGNNTAYIHILDTVTGQEPLFIGGVDFDWSPTASQLAVVGGGGIRIVDIPEGTEQWLLKQEFGTELHISSPRDTLDWLPEGRTILFAAATRTDFSDVSIYAVGVDGGNFRNLISDVTQLPEGHIHSIQVSPDGNHVLGSSGNKLIVLDISSGEVRQLASGLSGPSVWSPDSMSIVFGSYQDEEGDQIRTWELFQVSMVDGDITRLTFDEAAPIGLTW